MNGYEFVLGWLTILALAGAWKRYLEYRVKIKDIKEDKDADI